MLRPRNDARACGASLPGRPIFLKLLSGLYENDVRLRLVLRRKASESLATYYPMSI